MIDVKAKRRNLVISLLIAAVVWFFLLWDVGGDGVGEGEKLFFGTLITLTVVLPVFFATLFTLQFATWLMSKHQKKDEKRGD